MNLRDTGIQSLPFPTSATPQTTLSQTVELQEAGFVFNGTKNKIFLCCVAPSPRDPGSVSLRHRPDPRARTEPRGSPAGRERPPARRGLARRSPAQPSPAAPLSAPRRRAERGAGGGPHPGPARGRALSGRGSPPTRPAPPQPGLGLPLPLPLLRASRRHTRLGQAAHSASAIFSPPSGGGAAQARWVQRGT